MTIKSEGFHQEVRRNEFITSTDARLEPLTLRTYLRKLG